MSQLKQSASASVPWEEQLRAMVATRAAQTDRNLFRDFNPGHEYSPILEKPPRRPRPASVLIPVVAEPEEPRVLMTVRTPTMPSHAGEISFPGGGPKDGDATEEDTALREMEEEVGIDRADVTVVGRLGVHFGGLGYAVTPVIGLVSPRATISPCPREVAEAFTVPLRHLVAPENYLMEERSFNGIGYRMVAVPYNGARADKPRHIWGLTAGILDTFAMAFNNLPLEAGVMSRMPQTDAAT